MTDKENVDQNAWFPVHLGYVPTVYYCPSSNMHPQLVRRQTNTFLIMVCDAFVFKASEKRKVGVTSHIFANRCFQWWSDRGRNQMFYYRKMSR